MLSKQAFLRFITANIEYKDDIALLRKLVIINALVLAIILLFSVFSVYNLFRNELLIAALDLAGLVMCGYAYIQLYAYKRLDFTVVMVSLTLIVFLLALAYTGQNREYSLIWTFFLPLFVFMLNGRKVGGRMVLFFYAILIPMAFLNIGEWQNGDWTFTSFLRFSIASLVMIYTCYYSELAMEKSYSSFKEAQQEEKRLLAERNDLMLETIEKQDKLLADVSHELRTPLAVMRVKLEMLQDCVVKEPLAVYQSLQQKISELDKLIHDLSMASALGREHLAVHLEPIELNYLIEEAIARSKINCLENSLSITFFPSVEACSVYVNKENIRLVFEKLLDNCQRYTDKPGRVIITTAITDKQVCILIEDSAPGVDKNELEKLFDRLYRVENSRNRETGGSGLGLSVAKAIVEAHVGTIALDSSPLGGLAVKIALPLAG